MCFRYPDQLTFFVTTLRFFLHFLTSTKQVKNFRKKEVLPTCRLYLATILDMLVERQVFFSLPYSIVPTENIENRKHWLYTIKPNNSHEMFSIISEISLDKNYKWFHGPWCYQDLLFSNHYYPGMLINVIFTWDQ